jgi:LDH2 family malate/lactate/ureidoglycolate dehydrogenase
VGGTYIASDHQSNVGHCFIAIDPMAFTPTFRERMDRLASDIRAVGGRLPGDRRHAERARRLDEGIELADDLIAELRAHSVSLS